MLEIFYQSQFNTSEQFEMSKMVIITENQNLALQNIAPINNKIFMQSHSPLFFVILFFPDLSTVQHEEVGWICDDNEVSKFAACCGRYQCGIVNVLLTFKRIIEDRIVQVLLNVGCLSQAARKKPFIPMINRGRKWVSG